MMATLPQFCLLGIRKRIRLRQAIILHQNPGAALQGRDQVAQDPVAVFVGPVVEDPAEEVDVGAFDRLLGHEVVGHESHAGG